MDIKVERGENMFNKKSRKIAKQKQQIDKRDDYIAELEQKVDYYKQMTKEQREDLSKQDKILKDILELTEINTYGNDKAISDRIKELAKTAIQH